MTFRFRPMSIREVVLIEPTTFRDPRGFFRETYKRSEFADHGIPPFVQDNVSHSVKGVIRGLHYQKLPRAQGKCVSAMAGSILDIALDIRVGSPSYGEWVGAELSEENGAALYVPPGFAHGYCVLSDRATILYKVTEEYAPDFM